MLLSSEYVMTKAILAFLNYLSHRRSRLSTKSLFFKYKTWSSQGCELVQSGIWFPVLQNYALPWFAQLQYIVPAHTSILRTQKYTLQAYEGAEGEKSSLTATGVDLSITTLSAVRLLTVNTLKHSGRCTHHLRYFLTYLPTLWSRVLLEQLTVFQLVKKFAAFYGTRRFIHKCPPPALSWDRSIQSMPL